MTTATLTLKNLTRNRLRTLLTVLAIALPLLVFTVARSFVDLVNTFLAESDKNMRVAVHQKITFVTQLPQRIRGEIESFAPPGYVEAICRTSWFGGRVEGSQTTFPSMAVDRDTFHKVYPEHKLSAAEVEAFARERRGAVIGTQLAKRMNWKVGDRVELKGSIPPYPLIEFVIVAIPPALENLWFYFGLDYYDEIIQQAAGRPVGVNNFWLKCSSPQAREWALREIDRHFANSENETRTELESMFFAAFAKSGGDWVGMVWTIGQAIVLVAIMVAFNTMSMAFRERTRELAVMRALGFQAGRITRLVLTEGVLLGLIAGALAVGPVYGITQLVDISIPGLQGRVAIAPATVGIGMAVALAVGLLAAIVPAVMAARLQVAAALRKVV